MIARSCCGNRQWRIDRIADGYGALIVMGAMCGYQTFDRLIDALQWVIE